MAIELFSAICILLAFLLVWAMLSVASAADDESEATYDALRAKDAEQVPDEQPKSRLHPSVRAAMGRR